MLRRNCSSRKRLKRAKTEKQRKNKTNVCSLRKKHEREVSCRKCWFMMTSVKHLT